MSSLIVSHGGVMSTECRASSEMNFDQWGAQLEWYLLPRTVSYENLDRAYIAAADR